MQMKTVMTRVLHMTSTLKMALSRKPDPKDKSTPQCFGAIPWVSFQAMYLTKFHSIMNCGAYVLYKHATTLLDLLYNIVNQHALGDSRYRCFLLGIILKLVKMVYTVCIKKKVGSNWGLNLL